MLIVKVHSVNCVYKTYGTSCSLERTVDVWTTKPFTNWKKAIDEMKVVMLTSKQIKQLWHTWKHSSRDQLFNTFKTRQTNREC